MQFLLEMQDLCLTSPDHAYTQYEEAVKETYRESLQFACRHTSLFEQQTKTTAHQEARNKAGLPLQQIKVTCSPDARGTEDPTTPQLPQGLSYQSISPAKAGAGAIMHQHGNIEDTTGPL